MKTTIKMYAGKQAVKTFKVSSLDVDRFLVYTQEQANELDVAVTYECFSERRGMYRSGVIVPA